LKHKFKGVAGPCIACYLNTLTSGHFRGFSKKHQNTRGFASEFHPFGKCYGPGWSVETHGKSSSLYSKNFFAWGCGFFV